MRLIDADEFKEIILTYGKAGYAALRIEKLSELIDSQSTSYDVDGVVKQIEESSTDNDGIVCYVDRKPVITKEMATKIVKSGIDQKIK